MVIKKQIILDLSSDLNSWCPGYSCHNKMQEVPSRWSQILLQIDTVSGYNMASNSGKLLQEGGAGAPVKQSIIDIIKELLWANFTDSNKHDYYIVFSDDRNNSDRMQVAFENSVPMWREMLALLFLY
ncbi:hypothetical protein CEXT_275961 [Caerostris extrusa]|uniref:Uncharacterized protein n=1 Tax=Caerostris extrusa TaxID=172846 RepID=A0AAV4NB33_CAEEX|nr:hypothetical protein CEXT_275961 [Caerostris extrusa]